MDKSFGKVFALILACIGAVGCDSDNDIQNSDGASGSDGSANVPDGGATFSVVDGGSAAATPNSQMQAVLDKQVALGAMHVSAVTTAQARTQPSIADAVTALLASQGKSTAPTPVASVQNIMVTGGAGQIPARVYVPSGTQPFPIVVYFHGGGWVIATIDTYDASARAIANDAGAVVVSVEYRKGPENPFPAAHDDALAAYGWVLQNATTIQGDATRVAVVGESAGANLAANVARLAAQNNLRAPLHQVLIYPVAGNDMTTPSYVQFANAAPLSKADVAWFVARYVPNALDLNDGRLNLVAAMLPANPPRATVIAAEIDPLQSEGRTYAGRLSDVEYILYDGVTHEFFGTAAVVDQARTAQIEVGRRLRESFSK